MKKVMFTGGLYMMIMSFLACGGGDATKATNNETSERPFVMLTEAQRADVCKWISPEKIKTLFNLSDAKFDPPQFDNTSLQPQCVQRASKDGYGVLLTFHLRTYQDEETYNVSLGAGKVTTKYSNLKIVNVGQFGTIKHTSIPGTELTTSLLQVHGSSYSMDITSQYRGSMTEAELEKALIAIAADFLKVNP